VLDHYIRAYQALVGDLSENETLFFNTPLPPADAITTF
jgi:hypothetical protein